MTRDSAARLFGEGGLLSRVHPGFEERPGQVRMSEAVAGAISGARHLLMEAPTGTGKTFAYLAPAIESGRTVVVSTGTRNLQEQLFFKDLPQMERALGRAVPSAYLKGRHNYLCLKRARDFEEEPLFEALEEAPLHGAVTSWARETATGDRGELKDLPERLRFWDRIDARADTCLGQKCPDYEPCFLTRARRRAAESQVVVVNHHLLMADLLLKEHAFGRVIPEYSVLILDEAHTLEDVATLHLGRAISSHRVAELAADLERSLGGPAARRRADRMRGAAKEFFGALTGQEGRFALSPYRLDDHWRSAGAELLEAVSLAGSALREACPGPSEDTGQANLAERAREMAETLGLILAPEGTGEGPEDAPMITWGEARGRALVLQASPIDVSEPLRRMLFSQTPTVVLTSATLAIAGGFEFVKRRLGIDQADEIVLPSAFDLQRQAVLYVPRDFPEPRDAAFLPRLAEQIRSLLQVTDGRAFLLFTSFANLHRARDLLAGTVPYPLLAQGEASRHALLERFRATPGCVLLATSSFWQGVDVQGEALSLVVIDKLPFDVPSDPVVAARIETIRRAGGSPFGEYQVPAAVIDLKQGLGRLIRSRRDRGILAVMDSRLVTRSYGRVFLDSLPPYPLVHDIQSARSFFDAAR